MPLRKAAIVPSEMKKDKPIPTVVNNTVAMTIVLVEGKATRLMKL
jgi:hypothetical protein